MRILFRMECELLATCWAETWNHHTGDLDAQIKVVANIETIELTHKEQPPDEDNLKRGGIPTPVWDRLLLTSADARELAEMLNRAADHCDELNR